MATHIVNNSNQSGLVFRHKAISLAHANLGNNTTSIYTDIHLLSAIDIREEVAVDSPLALTIAQTNEAEIDSGLIEGTNDNDLLLGNSDRNTIYGYRGNDTLFGGYDNDEILIAVIKDISVIDFTADQFPVV